MTIQLFINSIDRGSFLVDYELEETIEWYNSEAVITLIDDVSGTLYNNLARYQDVKLYNDDNSAIIFRGVIVSIKKNPNNTSMIELECYDYWFLLTRKHITRTFTNMTASAIIKDVIDTYFSSTFTYTGVVSTVETYTIAIRGKNVARFFHELAITENFLIYVDENKDIIFREEDSVSSGVSLSYGTDIIEEEFNEDGHDIVNMVFIQGKGGSPNGAAIGYLYIDYDLLDEMGEELELPKIVDTSLTTLDQCRARGELEIKRHNQSPNVGRVKTIRNTSLQTGKTVKLTIPHRGYTADDFLIRSVRHVYSEDISELAVIYTTKTNADLVGDIITEARKNSEEFADDSTVYPKLVILNDTLELKAYITVEKRVFAGTYYGNHYDGSGYYGTQNTGTWTTVLPEEEITVLNSGIKKLVDLIKGIDATVLDGDNTYLAWGADSTTINYGDTSLNNEVGRVKTAVDSPDLETSSEITWRFEISDSEMDSGTIQNIGLLDANTLGTLILASVLSSAFSKSTDENYRFTIRLVFTTARGNVTSIGIAKFIDIITGYGVDLPLNGTNTHLEISTTTPYREQVASGYPKSNVAGTFIRWLLDLSSSDIISNSLDGESYTDIKMYDVNSGGSAIVDGTVSATRAILIDQSEPQQIEVKLKVGRK